MREHAAVSVFRGCHHHRWGHQGIRAVPPEEARRKYHGCAVSLSRITCTADHELLPHGIPLKDMRNWCHAVFTCSSLKGGVLLVWYDEHNTGEENPLCEHMGLRQYHGGPVRGEITVLVVPKSLTDPPLAKDSRIFFAPDLRLIAHFPHLYAPLRAEYFHAAQLFCKIPPYPQLSCGLPLWY